MVAPLQRFRGGTLISHRAPPPTPPLHVPHLYLSSGSGAVEEPGAVLSGSTPPPVPTLTSVWQPRVSPLMWLKRSRENAVLSQAPSLSHAHFPPDLPTRAPYPLLNRTHLSGRSRVAGQDEALFSPPGATPLSSSHIPLWDRVNTSGPLLPPTGPLPFGPTHPSAVPTREPYPPLSRTHS